MPLMEGLKFILNLVCEYVEEKVVSSMQLILNCNKVKRPKLFEKDRLER